MAKLTDDERKLLDELTARASEPDEDDYEIEIYDTSAGRGARIPVSKGRSWLYDNFGIGEPPEGREPPEENEDGKAPKGGKKPAGNVSQGYFGRAKSG